MDQAALRDHLSAAYAAGALGPGLSLLVETQAALSADAAGRVALAEAAAGAMLEAEAPAAMKAGALESVFARIAQAEETEASPRGGEPSGAFAEDMKRFPDPVKSAALDALKDGAWAFGGPGIRILQLKLADEARCELIRIEPGFAAPRHTHEGEEYTLVLTGAFTDGRGRYRVGDVAVAGPGITHRPRADEGEVCYNLAISEAPMIFTGLLGAAQKMWRH